MLQLHDSETDDGQDMKVAVTCREQDAAWLAAGEARRLEALKEGWRYGVMAGRFEALLEGKLSDEERASYQEQLAGLEKWYAESVKASEEARASYSAKLTELSGRARNERL